MATRSAAAALVSCVAAFAAGYATAAENPPSASPGPYPGPYEEMLARQGARLGAEVGDPGAAGALAALAVLDENVPPAAFEAAVRRGIRPGAEPLVAAQASSVLAHLLDERGATDEATALRSRLGFLSRFLVVGPFGDGRASFATAFPPEREISAEAGHRFPGKSGEVSWRSADAAVRDGALFLDGLLRPDDQAVAYLATYVRSDSDRPVALRLGSPGPIKVWVNGALVFTHDVVRPVGLDQDAFGVRLARGWNRILIKTVVVDGAWRVYARLTDPAGVALGLPNASRPPKSGRLASAPRAARPPPPGVATLDQLLEQRARSAGKGPTGAAAWLDLARYLAWNTPRDREQRAAADAAAQALALAPSLEARWVAAEVADEDDDRRRELERALEAQPLPGASLPATPPAEWRALLLERLGELARIERRPARAMEAFREALGTDPHCWPATLAIAQEEEEAELPLTALERVVALPPEVRALPRVRRVEARLEEAAGRRRDADRILESLANERRVEVDLLQQLATRARARGDGAEAEARLAAAAALRPDLPSFDIELSRLYEGSGRSEAALARLTALGARLPDDPATLVALGKLLHRMGRNGEALDRLREALALRPQDPELKRYVDRLAAGGSGDLTPADELARRFAEDARKLIPAERAATGDPALVLLDRRVVRVHRNGLSRTFAQRVVQILTERGAEDEKAFAVHYTPGSEEVDVRQARVYRRDARGEIEVFEATDRSDEDQSEPWYGLYYDNRAEVVRFEGLRPGDVVEIQYLVDDVSQENQMADYFGDLQLLAETIPKRRWDYTLIAPASRPIHTNVPRVAGLERRITDEGSDRVYRFSADNIAKVDAEPAAPGLAEIAPYLHVSTYATWNDVGAFYWHLVEEQLEGDEDFRKTARALVTPGMSDEARVRAVYDFVVTSTRYVGLEFGIHGYKPYKVTQVLERRFGDCKDKASLMVALLREVGVPAELVLLRTRREGKLDPEPASLAIFDHAIVYVPELDRYLDGTAEFSGASELPAEDQGVMVLRVSPAAGVLTETPVLPSSASHVERRWQVALEPSGDARVDETLTIRGQAAPNWREHYQTSGERADRYGRVWAGRFPGARLDSVEMPRIDDRELPVTVRASVTVPRFGQLTADGKLELPVSGREPDFVRTYARLSARRQDLVLAYPWQHEEEITYRLPAGWRLCEGGPAGQQARDVKSAFGRFHVEVSADGDLVRVRSSLDVVQSRIVPDDYLRFRAFLGEIDAAIEANLVVAPARVGS